MTQPPVISLTDCADPNALARQSARIAALFGATPSVLPLAGPDPEGVAALTLLDLLRATDLVGGPTHPAVVLVNIAPRDGHWPNGAPFCYFRHREHLVISTLNPRVLAPLSTFLGLTEVHVTDVREVLEAAAAQWAELAPAEVEEIARTQFRSLWYVPLLARWLVDGRPVPARPHALVTPGQEAGRPVRCGSPWWTTSGTASSTGPPPPSPATRRWPVCRSAVAATAAVSGCAVTTGCPMSRTANRGSPRGVRASDSPNWSYAVARRPKCSACAKVIGSFISPADMLSGRYRTVITSIDSASRRPEC